MHVTDICICVYMYMCIHTQIDIYLNALNVCTYKRVQISVHMTCARLSYHWCTLDDGDTAQHFHISFRYIKSKKKTKKTTTIIVNLTVGQQREAEGCHTSQLPNALWCWTLTNHWLFCPSCSQFLWSKENQKWGGILMYMCNYICVKKCTQDNTALPSCGFPHQWSRGKRKV